jgi:uncharacterized protein YaiI (UPF0178 family)
VIAVCVKEQRHPLFSSALSISVVFIDSKQARVTNHFVELCAKPKIVVTGFGF